MPDLSPEYWNNRYRTNEFSWDIGDVSEPLKAYFEQLTNKNLKILIPGAGNAYEAEFLFNNGFKNVFVLDFALEPLENIKKRVPSFPTNQLIHQDFFSHNDTYDLIIEQTFFCALNPSLRNQYAKHMHQLLNKTGKLVGVLFNDTLNLDKPPFGGNKQEYETIFTPYFNFNTMEVCYNSIKPRSGRELFVIFNKK